MEQIINKIRELSLRSWALISLAASIFITILSFAGIKSGGGLELIMILGRIPNLIFIGSLVCFAINNEKKIQVALLLTVLGVLIGIVGVFSMFSGYNGVIIREAVGYGGSNVEDAEFQKYIFDQMFTYNILQFILYIAALGLGLNALYKYLQVPYIILFVGCLGSLFVVLISNSGSTNYSTVNLIPSGIVMIGMIWTMVVGGKDNIQHHLNISDKKVQFSTVTPSPQRVVSSAVTNKSSHTFDIKDKSRQLFKLKELLDSGILTEEEFNIEKSKILNK